MLTRITRSAPIVQRLSQTAACVRAAPLVARAQPLRTAARTHAALPTAAHRGFSSDVRTTNIAKIVDTIAGMPARNNSLTITAAGPDRPGIVHDMTKLLTASGANLEESRMAVLGGDFAILLRVSVPDGFNKDDVKAALEKDFSEFAIGVRSSPVAGASTFQNPVRILSVQVEGPDQPGIVQTLTKVFVDMKGSVRDLDTDCSNAPFAGYKIFQLKCVVAFPIDTDFDAFEKALHQFEDSYGFDVQVHEGMQRDTEDEMDENEEGEEDMEDMDEEPEEEMPARRGAAPAARRGVAPPPPPMRAPQPQAAGRGPPQQQPRPAAPRGPAAPPRAAAAPPRGPPRR